MKKLIMTCGVPGSGKSSWNKAYASSHENVRIVDTDEVRFSVMGDYQTFPEDRHILYDKMIQLGNEWFALHENEDCTVIEDSTFTDNYRRKYYMERLKGYDEATLILFKMHDYSICYKRNRMRRKEKWVPDEVITSFIKNYKEPTEEVKKFFKTIRVIYLDE